MKVSTNPLSFKILLISTTFFEFIFSKSLLDSETCMKKCYPICYETRTIHKSECDFLCSSQCEYPTELLTNLNNLQVKCLLLCARLSYEKQACDSICNIKSNQESRSIEKITINDSIEDKKDDEIKQDLGQGCIGYGSEVCYKLCRLHERESVKTCYCACCSHIENDIFQC